jgi:plasmid stabilization system protein ParE
MSGYVLGIDAAQDLEEIWEFIAADKIDAANRWIGKPFDAFEPLARTPSMDAR